MSKTNMSLKRTLGSFVAAGILVGACTKPSYAQDSSKQLQTVQPDSDAMTRKFMDDLLKKMNPDILAISPQGSTLWNSDGWSSEEALPDDIYDEAVIQYSTGMVGEKDSPHFRIFFSVQPYARFLRPDPNKDGVCREISVDRKALAKSSNPYAQQAIQDITDILARYIADPSMLDHVEELRRHKDVNRCSQVISSLSIGTRFQYNDRARWGSYRLG